MGDRQLSFIVVPHGELETRSYSISYRRLRVYVGAAAILLLAFIVVVSSWWYVAAQAARVPGLEREVARLEQERERVAELARTLSEVEAQYERVRRLLGADAAPAGAEPLLPPLRTGEDSVQNPQGAAMRPDSWPLTESGFITRALSDAGAANHPGLDIAIAAGSYVRAAGDGTVADAGDDGVYGNYVLIDHGGELQTMYGHASEIFVQEGDVVRRNEVIALSGSTGRSTAPHLHFEVRRAGEPVDPLEFVTQP
jgi:murein DD-endopeptidase MepM/ murein hydrolase activator NlpD